VKFVDMVDDDMSSDVVEILALMGQTPLPTTSRAVVILMHTEKS
jgi:hypothetical protein